MYSTRLLQEEVEYWHRVRLSLVSCFLGLLVSRFARSSFDTAWRMHLVLGPHFTISAVTEPSSALCVRPVLPGELGSSSRAQRPACFYLAAWDSENQATRADLLDTQGPLYSTALHLASHPPAPPWPSWLTARACMVVSLVSPC